MDIDLARVFKNAVRKEDGDFTVDGLLYCGKCKQPKQARTIVEGAEIVIPDVCECERRRREQERERENRERREEHVRTWKKRCFGAFGEDGVRIGEKMRFDEDRTEAESDAEKICRKYAERFGIALEKNYGLVLYGNVGVGKTYLAACICSKVIENEFTAVFCNLASVAHNVISIKESEREEAASVLRSTDLVVIDDFGVERKSEYMDEAVQRAIDIRYQSGKPIIITTNLTPDDFKNPMSVAQRRIFSRIIEMCRFIEVDGADRRKKLHNDKNRDFKKDIEEG